MVQRQRQRGASEKGKGKSKGKSDTQYCYDCGKQEHIGVNCPYKWANSIDEEDYQTSSWESGLEGENGEEIAKENGAGLRRAESPGGEGELTHDHRSTTLQKTMKVSKRPED